MKKNEYIKPWANVVFVDPANFAAEIPTTGPSDETSLTKGTDTWEEPESDDDGFGW